MNVRFDPAWLQAQYDNRARVPDNAAVLERWRSASAAARAARPPLAGLRYGSGPDEAVDVFPAGVPGAPVLVFIHGGYWRALSKEDFSFLAPAFNAAGVTLVVPDYALCPAVSVEHIARQMAAATAWAWHQAPQWGSDRARMAVAGHSAGGHLVAMMLSCRWKQVDASLPPQILAGGLAVSGVFDMEPLRHAPFLQADLQLTPASVARLSPAFFPRPRGARLFAVVGGDESEEFIRQTRLIREVWGPSAVPVCETVSGTNHFTVMNGLADPQARLHRLALRLLGRDD